MSRSSERLGVMGQDPTRRRPQRPQVPMIEFSAPTRQPACRTGRLGADRPAEDHANDGATAMGAGKVLLWIIFYIAIAVSAVGRWWCYRRDQFSWTDRSIELLDRRILGWASPAFHYGALAAVSGHFIRLCIPTPGPARSASPRAPTSGSRRSRGRHWSGYRARLPAARDHRVAVLGVLPVQPARPRLEHLSVAPRAPLLVYPRDAASARRLKAPYARPLSMPCQYRAGRP
jgi:Nitrate reductase gamma subunit